MRLMYSPKKGPPKEDKVIGMKFSRTIKIEPKAFLNEIFYEIETILPSEK